MRTPRRLAMRARTVRWRFTALYGAMFLMSGVGLLVINNLVGLWGTQSSHVVSPGAAQVQPATFETAMELNRLLQAELSQVRAAQSRQLLAGSIVALGVMALVSVALGRIVAARVLRPLRTITAATRRISADDLHTRLAVAGPADEVKDLADTIDGLLERLEASFTAQRRFVANASHELRTPLTTMRASLDVAMAKPEPVPAQTAALADRLRAELDRVDRLLEGFLLLARSRHGASSDDTAFSLGHAVSAALDARAADISDKGLTVHDDTVDDRAWTRGNPTLLARMIDNVIDNAVKHNHDGGWIRCATRAEDQRALLVVETGGPVLDQGQVALLAQPFQRLSADRTGSDNGSGLGLSIVAAVAEAHGGGLDLRARPEGGLRVAVSLPLTSAQAGVPA
ncbi:sensor histidine kinase [Microtetraspora fusca]|uniref:sensor histidine kinase n=1 Tax=Microtetraspora fusca TaxID=1997 RepID=UPI00082FE406|nr:HAMP domain-containing sensor histidine kinase [Microtetraspora fusca]